MSNIDRPIETELYIDGEIGKASDGGTYPIHNPARPDELVGHAAKATVADVDAAVAAATRAYPAWSKTSYGERAALLNRIADELVADEEDVKYRSRLFCREHGKVLKETLLEMTRLGDRFRLTASFADRLAADERLSGPPFDTIITRQPRGVAVLIVPWNWPLSILGAKLPQALMAGNTVVVKPSMNSALAPSLTLHKIAALLPAGVVNVVTGKSGEIGDALVGHGGASYVNFTGSIEVGKHVMRVAAANLTPVTLELGGNDPAIVLEDAELDPGAFMRMYLGTFMSSGQICMALKRLYVHRSRYDEVVAGLTAACEKQVIGDGLLEGTTMGPVNNRRQLETVTGMLEEARAAGADLKECGEVPDEDLYAGGYFQKPTLAYDPDPALRLVTEEQFGPPCRSCRSIPRKRPSPGPTTPHLVCARRCGRPIPSGRLNWPGSSRPATPISTPTGRPPRTAAARSGDSNSPGSVAIWAMRGSSSFRGTIRYRVSRDGCCTSPMRVSPANIQREECDEENEK